jgi:hypothetical protein
LWPANPIAAISTASRASSSVLGSIEPTKAMAALRVASSSCSEGLVAVGQLRKGHDAKLLGATEATRPAVAAVSIDDAMEGLPRQKVHGLREQGLAEIDGDSEVAKTRDASANDNFRFKSETPHVTRRAPPLLAF